MKAFISWAGERSKKTAEVFVAWLPLVIRELEPWIAADAAKGGRFTPEISADLGKSKIAILCLTPENLNDHWILFEANCLSKFHHLMVCTFLLEVNPSDIKPPLSQFPYTNFAKDDVHLLVQTINNQLSPAVKPLPGATLSIIFNRYWPRFENQLHEIIPSPVQKNKEVHAETGRRPEVKQVASGGIQRHTAKVPEIHETAPLNVLAITERRYFTLVNEIGISPNEAIKTIMKELDTKYALQIETRNMFFGHLMDFIQIKQHF